MDDKAIYRSDYLQKELRAAITEINEQKDDLSNVMKRIMQHMDLLEESVLVFEKELSTKMETHVKNSFTAQLTSLKEQLDFNIQASLQSLKTSSQTASDNIKSIQKSYFWRTHMITAAFCLGCLATSLATQYFFPHSHVHNYNVDSKLANEAKMGQQKYDHLPGVFSRE